MKKILSFILLSVNMIASQDLSSLKAWESILQTPELVEYFDDVFNHLGITIEESGERFTIHHIVRFRSIAFKPFAISGCQ